ncbi:uncharacterized protein LOC115400431 [Salarias fasciatus]|uniref:uncharacterized protein LOC115400431 n=1 Tax=Salarias fasciatus TaxID=181472 RepID=UPI001176ABB4|nr:uncharacterized protein LOC115400431 [Salarias fasciatus]
MPRTNKRSQAQKRRFQQQTESHDPTPESAEHSSNLFENMAAVLLVSDEVRDVSSDVVMSRRDEGNVMITELPSEIRLCASRSQSSARFGKLKNKQCTCNSLTFLAFLHENEMISKADLDLVLDKGNVLYQQAIKIHPTDGTGYLATDELPNLVSSRSSTLTADLSILPVFGTFGNPPAGCMDTYLSLSSRLNCLTDDVQYALLIMVSLCIAVFRTPSGRYGFFDPHSRKDDGSYKEPGTAVMVTFKHLQDMVNRLLRCYREHGASSTTQYEFKPVTFVSIRPADRVQSVEMWCVSHLRSRKQLKLCPD